MRRRRGWGGVLLAFALAAAACSESNGGDAGPVGGDDGPVRLSLILPDLGPLVEIGLAPDLGDVEANYEVFVDEVNEAGGAAGRDLEIGFQYFPAGSTATDQQAQCVGATQDDDAFAVILTGGIVDETVLCVTEQNERIALVTAGVFPETVFERSEGRLFTNGISAPRLIENMVDALDEQGELDGRTLGLVRADLARDAEVADQLRAALEDRGYELAEDVALPCEGTSCQQMDVGVQRLTTAGVDAVFSFLSVIAYPAFVGEAGAQGYTPQWFSSDLENQVFATTAEFFEGPAAGFYDGAIGITATGMDDTEDDEFRVGCNERVAAATGAVYEFGTDAWRTIGTSCEMIGRIVRVIEAVDADGEPFTQAAFIEYMEQERVVNGQSRGEFGPGKHDAYDVLELRRFSAGCVCWEAIEGARFTAGGDGAGGS